MSNRKNIPGYKLLSTLIGFNDFTKEEIRIDKGNNVRVADDEWIKENQNLLLGYFHKGYDLRKIKSKFPDVKIQGILSEIEKMCTQYCTVPKDARKNPSWEGPLQKIKEPRENFASNEHWINPYDMNNSALNTNQIWWVWNRLRLTARGEYDGTDWERIGEETGMKPHNARLKFQHLLPAKKGLLYACR